MKALHLLVLALLSASFSEAAAETCKVRVVRAPDEVKPVIEAWVRAEPSCRHDLEVRVVATQDGGYYLYARDTAGRVRERVVPDAVAVGVLVASWIADDALPRAPSPIVAPPLLEPPPRVESSDPAAPARRTKGISFTLGAITSLAKGYGLRGELELSSAGFLLYGAASVGRSGMLYLGAIELYPDDRRLAAGVGYGRAGQRWGLRGRAGIVRARWTGDFGDGMADATFDGVEAGFRVSRRLGDRWSFVAGIDATRFIHANNLLTGMDAISIAAPELDVSALAGVTAHL